jgi:hypothetical protein
MTAQFHNPDVRQSINQKLLTYYDFRIAPNSFDFVNYLAVAQQILYLTQTEKMDVELVCPLMRNATHIEKSYEAGYNERKLYNVILHALSLCPFVDSFVLNRSGDGVLDPKTYKYTFPASYNPQMYPANFSSATTLLPTFERILTRLYNMSKRPPRVLQCTEKAKHLIRESLGDREFVTLTLRRSPHNPLRNFPVEFDLLVVRTIAGLTGKRVVVIPDQDAVFMNAIGHLAQEKAAETNMGVLGSMDLDLRLALYTLSYSNVVFATGPSSVVDYSENPYLLMGVLDESVHELSSQIHARKGYDIGTQRPWAKCNQVVNWTPKAELLDARTIQSVLAEYFSTFSAG